MRGLFIINPSSGKQTNQGKALQAMHELLKDQVIEEAVVFYTRGKGDARKQAYEAKREEYDFVVAVGGDGTVNEVVSGLHLSGSGIPLAIFPSGTSNDFARSVGISPTAYCLYHLIKDCHAVAADIGRFNDRDYFLNVTAGGILSDVAHSVSVEAKTLFGKTAYVAEALKKVSENWFRTTPLLFEMDGEREVFDVFFFILANSKSVGGVPKICVDAKINDGYMDLCVVKNVDALTALPVLTQIQAGTHIHNKLVEYRQVRDLRIFPTEETTEFHLDCDGEYAGELPLHAEVLQGGVQLLLPVENTKTKKIVMEDQGAIPQS